MPTEEELEQRVNDQIDSERVKASILSLEISKLKEVLKERM